MPNVFTSQRILSAFELTRLAAAPAGTYLVPSTAGGAVTPSAGMVLAVSAIPRGLVTVNGVRDTTGQAANTVTVTTAHTSLPRRDWVYYEPGVGFGVTAGTVAAKPALPSLTAGRIALAEVYVAANDTTIGSSEIIDRRQPVLDDPFAGVQALFRGSPPRKLLAEFGAVGWLASYDGTSVLSASGAPVGMGFTTAFGSTTATSAIVTNALLEAYTVMTAGSTTFAIGSLVASTSIVAATAPNKNPRMLVRWFPGGSSANLTTSIAGFLAGGGGIIATSAGAYQRVNTTGNLEFVTRQGGTETATSLGARPTTPTSYEIETIDAGVTWTCRNVTTGAVVATHTTNVPTATTGLGYVVGGISTATLIVASVVYVRVESDTVA